MAADDDDPLVDPRTWLRRAVAHAVESASASTASDPIELGTTALGLAEAGLAPDSCHQASASEAKQVAYLVVTTALARHSIEPRRRGRVAEAQAVAELLWAASRWLWSALDGHERVGACRVPPASAAPAVETRLGRLRRPRTNRRRT